MGKARACGARKDRFQGALRPDFLHLTEPKTGSAERPVIRHTFSETKNGSKNPLFCFRRFGAMLPSTKHRFLLSVYAGSGKREQFIRLILGDVDAMRESN